MGINHSSRWLAFVLAAFLLSGCLGGSGLVATEGVIAADYRDDEQVRVVTTARELGDDPRVLAFDRVVGMVMARNYERFALIRDKCETFIIQPSGAYGGTTCYLWAQMLSEGETAEPKGSDDEVVYYQILDNGEAVREPGQ